MEHHRAHPYPHKVPGAPGTVWDLLTELLLPLDAASGCLRTVASSKWSDFNSPKNFLPALQSWSLWSLLLERPTPASQLSLFGSPTLVS